MEFPNLPTLNKGDKRRGEEFKAAITDTKPSTLADLATIPLLAGQRDYSRDESADQIDVTTKDTLSRYREYLSGRIEGSISIDGVQVYNEESQKTLKKAFYDGSIIYLLEIDTRTQEVWVYPVVVTSNAFEAPYEDAATYSAEFSIASAPFELTEEGTPSGA